jgi:hypothetical protein
MLAQARSNAHMRRAGTRRSLPERVHGEKLTHGEEGVYYVVRPAAVELCAFRVAMRAQTADFNVVLMSIISPNQEVSCR